MKIEELLICLENANVSLTLDGEALVVKAPKGAVTETLRTQLVNQKSNLICKRSTNPIYSIT